ncbi:RNB domain-containing ribonuclease [Nocardioides mangrovicus]|nr:RNB domain-containing ribonuclease [Nocardioides mangrovicus]
MDERVMRVAPGAAGADGADSDDIRRGIAAIQAEQHLTPDFPADVQAEAERAAARLSSGAGLPDQDLTDLPFVTLDPASSTDLDQAMFLERDGDGFVVHYAIADLAAFVEPGGALDAETHRRGETLYGADSRIPLHPPVISEGAASLLPDQVRPALVWTLGLDAAGALTSTSLVRARVRSRQKLAYETGQVPLLEEIGTLRLQQEAARGGVSLPMPEQEVVRDGDRWRLTYRQPAPSEAWNAQISLLTGIAAASLMVEHRIGILRTLPPAPDHAVRRLRRTAKALDVPWPDGQDYPSFVRTLDPSKPNQAAMVVACTSLLRGAGYAAFDGNLPEQPEHAALATTYAHVTAPLRRLADRYALEVCVSLCAGTDVPEWVRTALPELPKQMADADHRAHAYERAVVDLVEAEILQPAVGRSFTGVVLEADHDEPTRGVLQVAEPAVEAPVSSTQPLPVGESVTATLASADPATRKVAFTLP